MPAGSVVALFFFCFFFGGGSPWFPPDLCWTLHRCEKLKASNKEVCEYRESKLSLLSIGNVYFFSTDSVATLESLHRKCSGDGYWVYWLMGLVQM